MRGPSELQICYQRNLLCGLISSLVLSMIVGIWIGGIEGTDSRSLFVVPEVGPVADDVDRAGVTDKTNQKHYLSMKKHVSKHEGFLGFVNIQPIGQILAVPDARPTDISREELYPDFSQEVPPDLPTSAGDAGGIMLSLGDYYALGTYDSTPNRLLVNRDVEVIWKPEPEYPFVAKDVGKQGMIIVLVFIDNNGALAPFPDWMSGEGINTLEYTINGENRVFQYAINEEPADWFFAKNFMKVLPKWMFTPKIESGIAVSSLLRIKFYFCLGVNCLRLELEQVQSR